MQDPVSIPKAELQLMLQEAGKQGAREVLHCLGLSDEEAANDIRDIRSFIRAWRLGKNTIFKTTIKVVTTAVLFAAAAAIGIKIYNG